jgi:hypothetical protein
VDVSTKTLPRLMPGLLLIMSLLTLRVAYAEEPNPGDEKVLVRKGLLTEARDRIDATDRQLVIVTGQRDSLKVDLAVSEATKPAKRSVIDSFEVGMATGVVIVLLTIWVLDAQLE